MHLMQGSNPIYLLLLQFQSFPRGGAQFLHLSSMDSIPTGEARPKWSSFAHIFIDEMFKIANKKALKSTVQIQTLSRHIRIILSMTFFLFFLKTENRSKNECTHTNTPAQWPVPLPSPPLSAVPSRPSALTLTWFSLPESQKSSIRLSGQVKKKIISWGTIHDHKNSRDAKAEWNWFLFNVWLLCLILDYLDILGLTGAGLWRFGLLGNLPCFGSLCLRLSFNPFILQVLKNSRGRGMMLRGGKTRGSVFVPTAMVNHSLNTEKKCYIYYGHWHENPLLGLLELITLMTYWFVPECPGTV